ISGGSAWRQTIEAELNVAKCALVVWSKRSAGPSGTFVQDEATRAQERHAYVPVLIDKVHLPLGFGETQAFPLSGWHGNRSDPHYRAIVAAVAKMAGEGNGSPAGKRQKIYVNRRAVLAGGGAIAGVAIVGTGGWMVLKPGTAAAS